MTFGPQLLYKSKLNKNRISNMSERQREICYEVIENKKTALHFDVENESKYI